MQIFLIGWLLKSLRSSFVAAGIPGKKTCGDSVIPQGENITTKMAILGKNYFIGAKRTELLLKHSTINVKMKVVYITPLECPSVAVRISKTEIYCMLGMDRHTYICMSCSGM